MKIFVMKFTVALQRYFTPANFKYVNTVIPAKCNKSIGIAMNQQQVISLATIVLILLYNQIQQQQIFAFFVLYEAWLADYALVLNAAKFLEEQDVVVEE